MSDVIKTMYIHDPLRPCAVTIVRRTRPVDGETEVEFALATNFIVTEESALSRKLPRVRSSRINGRTVGIFGDAFSRKRGRSIALDRLESGNSHKIRVKEGDSIVGSVLDAICASSFGASRNTKNAIKRARREKNKAND